MEPKQQVCTIEQAKKLKELGWKQQSLFGYIVEGEDVTLDVDKLYYSGSTNGWAYENQYAAYNVGELGEMLIEKSIVLKLHIEFEFSGDRYLCMFGTSEDGEILYSYFPTEAQARAELLIHKLLGKKVAR